MGAPSCSYKNRERGNSFVLLIAGGGPSSSSFSLELLSLLFPLSLGFDDDNDSDESKLIVGGGWNGGTVRVGMIMSLVQVETRVQHITCLSYS